MAIPEKSSLKLGDKFLEKDDYDIIDEITRKYPPLTDEEDPDDLQWKKTWDELSKYYDLPAYDHDRYSLALGNPKTDRTPFIYEDDFSGKKWKPKNIRYFRDLRRR